MVKREEKHYKALYFDMSVKALEKYFSNTNPTHAYRKIQNYLMQRNFSHVQHSGYHSKFQSTDMKKGCQRWKVSK